MHIFSLFLPPKCRKTDLNHHFLRASSIVFVMVMAFFVFTSTGGAQPLSSPDLPNLPKPEAEKNKNSLKHLRNKAGIWCGYARELLKEAKDIYDEGWVKSPAEHDEDYKRAYANYKRVKAICEKLTEEYNRRYEEDHYFDELDNAEPLDRNDPITNLTGSCGKWVSHEDRNRQEVPWLLRKNWKNRGYWKEESDNKNIIGGYNNPNVYYEGNIQIWKTRVNCCDHCYTTYENSDKKNKAKEIWYKCMRKCKSDNPYMKCR